MPELRTLMTGIAFGESPRWHGGRVWFSDWGTGEVIAVDPANPNSDSDSGGGGGGGGSEVVARVASFPLCIDFLPDGRLLLVSSIDRLLLRQEADCTLSTHADLGVLSHKPWNDIVVDGRGNAYVNNTGFDFPGGEPGPGTVVLVTPDGSVRQVADGLMFPNGMAVTPDNATLIVAESYANRLTAFEIAADGSLSHQREWAGLGDGVPDGICLDADNAVWYADVPNKRCVRVREGGEVLATVDLDRGGFSCALGGTDLRTLFVTANVWGGNADADAVGDADGEARTGQLLALEVTVPGAGWP